MPFFLLVTKVLSTIKDGLVRYYNTKTSRNGVNNMWILKNSTSLLLSLDQLDVRTATSVQTFDFSTLFTSIPHDLLKSRISNLAHNAFRRKDGSVIFCYYCIEYIKLDTCAKFHDHRGNNNKVMMGGPHAPLPPSKKTLQCKVCNYQGSI